MRDCPRPHPLANLIPEMLRDEYCELVADIKANGLKQPIMLYGGMILDGRHRAKACAELGITPTTVEFAGSEQEAKALVLSLNVQRRHLTHEQKLVTVDAELKRDPAQSDRAIATKAKVSPTTVGKVRASAERRGEVSTVDTIIGVDGVKQPKKITKKRTVPKQRANVERAVAHSAAPAERPGKQRPIPIHPDSEPGRFYLGVVAKNVDMLFAHCPDDARDLLRERIIEIIDKAAKTARASEFSGASSAAGSSGGAHALA
jgi:hypothetical protein